MHDTGSDLARALAVQAHANELLINWLRLALFVGTFVLHCVSYHHPIVPFPITPTMLIAELCCVVLVLALHIRLRRTSWPDPVLFSLADMLMVGVVLLLIGDSIQHSTALSVPLAMLVALVAVATLRFSPPAVLASGTSAIVIYGVYYATRTGEVIEAGLMLAPLVLATAAAFVASRRLLELFLDVQRKARLERFLAPEVVAEIDAGEHMLALGGEERTVSILFCDIRNFTTMSEQMSPGEVVALLNDHLSRMTESVFSHSGTVDKFIGDAIMAVFGAPLPCTDSADRAVSAALAMRAELADLNRQRRDRGELELGIGIGIHSGVVVAGAIGSPRRMDYTVIGDAVNVAARVESLTREFDTDLIVTEETLAALSGDFTTRPLGTANVKGRTAPVTIHAVV